MHAVSKLILVAVAGVILSGCVVREGGGYYGRGYGYDRGYGYAERDRYEHRDYDRDRYYWR
jgi:hypothetical protein